jgi:thioredoxin-related protein
LTLIDGIAPPRTHSEDNFRWVNGGLETGLGRDSISIQYASEMHSVGDGSILVFHDLAIGKEYAKKKNLPILLDFTGYACQNCRKMESSVWTNDEIRPLLQKQFVIISLYVDDRTPLPANEVRFSKSNGNIKTFGNKWADLEINKYRSSQQPLYIVTDSEGNDLTSPSGYTPNANEFKSFLMKGVNNFKNKKNSRDSMQTIKQLVPKKCCCCCN